MSRDHDGWCPYCQKDHAIYDCIDTNDKVTLFLYWCKATGNFWYERQVSIELEHMGSSEKDWDKVEQEAYQYFEKIKDGI